MQTLFAIPVTLTLIGGGQTLLAQDRAAPTVVQPPDVFARVELLRAEIELVRGEIGAPRDQRPEVTAKDVATRENYFQALTLVQKARRLGEEFGEGDHAEFPTPPGYDHVRPADVLALVDATLVRVRRVKQRVGNIEECEPPPRDSGKTPSDVFRAIVQANRQLDLLLDGGTTPTHVNEQLQLANEVARNLLGAFPRRATPENPERKRRMRAADVHQSLADCARQMHVVMTKSGLTMLTVDWNMKPEQVTPSDVYDLATVLVSELRYLESLAPGTKGHPATARRVPGRKLPSENFRLAGLLGNQVRGLRKLVEARPGPLKFLDKPN
ncbi:MAG: hypothetical protein ACP5XB_06420 [Isosphaeraceae bacterium]